MTARPRLELYRATWRPTLMWWLVLTVAIPFGLFIATLLVAVAYAVWKAVLTGQPVPNLLGGLESLPWAYIIPGFGALFGGYVMRGQGSGGGQDQQRPFEPSHTPGPPSPEPSPTGGLVNNGAINPP